MTANKGMSREQAGQLYDSLKKSMEAKYGKKGLAALIAEEKKQGRPSGRAAAAAPRAARGQAQVADEMARVAAQLKKLPRPGARGQRGALLFIMCAGFFKLALSGIAAAGIVPVEPADAALIAPSLGPQFTPDEVTILKSLDERRVGLEERGRKLEEREEELERRDREFAARLTQLRELSERLKQDREKTEKRRTAQLDQLAAVYGSMNPQEAAQLLEQLDVSIALSLVERMPEKRIGQILALMTPERALTLTQMLSRRGAL